MEFSIKQTNELEVTELLDIARERINVFVVEQNCAYQEMDESDRDAIHVLLKNGPKIVAYTRIINRESHVTFGRVLVVKSCRGQGFGRIIVSETINQVRGSFPDKTIKIAAQTYLVNFYETFGFKVVSDAYLEDGIWHIDMVLERILEEHEEV